MALRNFDSSTFEAWFSAFVTFHIVGARDATVAVGLVLLVFALALIF